MFIPRHNPHLYRHHDTSVSKTFSLLCWNIHKENTRPKFRSRLHELLHVYPSDFLIFQEYAMPKSQPHELGSLSYAMGANIETASHIYGLLTASSCAFNAKQITMTRHKELMFSTKKSVLLTSHSFDDTYTLHIINIHAINFVSTKVFTHELKQIQALAKELEGALIITGDFNSWSKRRMRSLEAFKKELSLKQALIKDAHHVKTIFKKPIDHIFYKGVELVTAQAIDVHHTSDHNPIHAIFKKI